MKRYITFKDYEEVLRIGKFWLDKCSDDYYDDGTLFHHLPLKDILGDPLDPKNFYMDDKYKKEFHKSMKVLEKYVKQVEAADKKAIVINYEIMDIRQILPPWIVYPHYPAQNVYLTPYYSLFDDFVSRMTKMELSVYRKLYPTPKYIESIFQYKEVE
ncbi:MAG: hypothetical protein J5625_10370 [Lachnospiraceae bacterium]|nr:hypothetical protein [Lachnospiraceae bacterium]